jgi:hypothetical protein
MRSQIGDVCFKRDGVFAMELGGPEVGRGCGGRGIIHGFETLEKLGFHDWDFDYVLLDFLGDVVCGGFGLPIARDMCQKVIVVASNDLQSLYVANNVCSAVEYFRKLGGNVGVAGMVTNKDDGTGEAQAFAEGGRHPGAGGDPADEDIRARAPTTRSSAAPTVSGARCSKSSRKRRRLRRRSSRRRCRRMSCWAVRWRRGRARRGAAAGHYRRLCGGVIPESSLPRGHLRRCLRPGHEHPGGVIADPRRDRSDRDDGRKRLPRRRGEDARRGAKAGKSEVLERYAKDYPTGPHDQPQSMCPAFGSLRVGLRMRRTATVLSGSACCVYGLTFTSHFYGARRTVGYVPFDSETLVTGKLFEDMREAVYALADPNDYDAIVVTNLCVPTASGVPLRTAAEGDQRRPDHRDRRAGVRRADPRRGQRRARRGDARLRPREAEQGPVAAPRGGRSEAPTVTLVGEMFPVDPITIGRCWRRSGSRCGPVVPTREWRELYAALDGAAVAAVHPFYTSAIRELQAAGRPVVGSAPVGYEGTAAWLEQIGEACGVGRDAIDKAKDRALPPIRAALHKHPDPRPHHAVRLRGLGAHRREAPRRERRRRRLRRHRVPANAVVGSRSRVARGPRRAR